MDRIHFLATVDLPTISSRKAQRAALAADVAEFLARGGEVRQVGAGVGRETIRPFNSTAMAAVRPAKKYDCKSSPATSKKGTLQ